MLTFRHTQRYAITLYARYDYAAAAADAMMLPLRHAAFAASRQDDAFDAYYARYAMLIAPMPCWRHYAMPPCCFAMLAAMFRAAPLKAAFSPCFAEMEAQVAVGTHTRMRAVRERERAQARCQHAARSERILSITTHSSPSPDATLMLLFCFAILAAARTRVACFTGVELPPFTAAPMPFISLTFARCRYCLRRHAALLRRHFTPKYDYVAAARCHACYDACQLRRFADTHTALRLRHAAAIDARHMPCCFMLLCRKRARYSRCHAAEMIGLTSPFTPAAADSGAAPACSCRQLLYDFSCTIAYMLFAMLLFAILYTLLFASFDYTPPPAALYALCRRCRCQRAMFTLRMLYSATPPFDFTPLDA